MQTSSVRRSPCRASHSTEGAWASEPGLRVDARQCRLARRRLERAVRFGAAERVRAFCEGLRAELAAELASEEPAV